MQAARRFDLDHVMRRVMRILALDIPVTDHVNLSITVPPVVDNAVGWHLLGSRLNPDMFWVVMTLGSSQLTTWKQILMYLCRTGVMKWSTVARYRDNLPF